MPNSGTMRGMKEAHAEVFGMGERFTTPAASMAPARLFFITPAGLISLPGVLFSNPRRFATEPPCFMARPSRFVNETSDSWKTLVSPR